jgi:hypothetical protein
VGAEVAHDAPELLGRFQDEASACLLAGEALEARSAARKEMERSPNSRAAATVSRNRAWFSRWTVQRAATGKPGLRAAPGQAGGWPTPIENATGFVTTRPAERKRRPHPRGA